MSFNQVLFDYYLYDFCFKFSVLLLVFKNSLRLAYQPFAS